VIQAWPADGGTGLHGSLFFSTTLAMEAGYRSLCDRVAGTMQKPEKSNGISTASLVPTQAPPSMALITKYTG